VREGVDGRGGSSSMVHKRNPVAAVSVLACAKRVPGLVATIFASMEQEHQRAAGAWQAEWGTLSELLTLTGSAAAWLADLLTSLEVDAARMRENLAFLAESGVAEPGVAEPGGSDAATIGLEAQLAGAGELIDRALAKVKR
jgi:3-carboxy-cis,cis-muconate cycloisomerase